MKHFHLAGKRQSPDQGEILLVVHWAVDRMKTVLWLMTQGTSAVFICIFFHTNDGDGAGRKSPPNRSIICSSATSLVGVTLGGGGTGGPFFSYQKPQHLVNMSSDWTESDSRGVV